MAINAGRQLLADYWRARRWALAAPPEEHPVAIAAWRYAERRLAEHVTAESWPVLGRNLMATVSASGKVSVTKRVKRRQEH